MPTIKEKMRGIQGYGWTSQMVENSRQQHRIRHIHDNMTDNAASIRYIMDVSQCWSSTPQGSGYWSPISNAWNSNHPE